MPDCILATCAALPNLDPDDWVLRDALLRRGIRARAQVWTAKDADWSADAVVIRSTWDYHERPGEFRAWVSDVSQRTRLINPASAVLWNAHKFYLRDLHERGVPVVPSAWMTQHAAFDLADVARRLRSEKLVIKPAYGASSHGVERLDVAVDPADGARVLANLLARQDAIVQPYLDLASHHERALVFIGGEYSHAVTKTPFMHAGANLALRADELPGTSGERPVDAAPDEIEAAQRALAAAPPGVAYARVDVVRDDDFNVRILELELIEPTLYFYARPDAAERLASVVEALTMRS